MPQLKIVDYVCRMCGCSHSVEEEVNAPWYDGLCPACEESWVGSAEYNAILQDTF